MDLERKYAELMELFNEIQQYVRQKNEHLYENWKAGGFQLDGTFFSNYQNLEQVVESLAEDEEPDDDEEPDFEDEDDEDD